ncbi:hypothetical protein [Ensifer sp. CCNWLW38]|uniref:hypothetical protein n=1 Tax=Ensifer sp. CCNWLW38 TaxID=3122071 RepID=UPI0030105D1E
MTVTVATPRGGRSMLVVVGPVGDAPTIENEVLSDSNPGTTLTEAVRATAVVLVTTKATLPRAARRPASSTSVRVTVGAGSLI